MTDYLITYDLKSGSPDPHKPFLTAAQKEGLLYVWKGAEYVSRLPNTTVWGAFASREAANDAFNRAVQAAGRDIKATVTVEKRATTALSDCDVLSDRRKKPEQKWTGSGNFETSKLHQLNDPFFSLGS